MKKSFHPSCRNPVARTYSLYAALSKTQCHGNPPRLLRFPVETQPPTFDCSDESGSYRSIQRFPDGYNDFAISETLQIHSSSYGSIGDVTLIYREPLRTIPREQLKLTQAPLPYKLSGIPLEKLIRRYDRHVENLVACRPPPGVVDPRTGIRLQNDVV